MTSVPRILVDARWQGNHGIARFSREVVSRIGAHEELHHGRVLSPLGPLVTSLAAMVKKPAVYFTPGFNPPLHAPCPVVFVIHDLIHLRFPAESSPAKTLYYRAVVRPAARRAAFVLTVSEFSKTRILEWTGIPEEKVRVVGNGVSVDFSTQGPPHPADRPYLLFVGNRKPHKNLPRVIQAFAQSTLAADADLYLSGGEDPDTCRQIARSGLESRVRFLGAISDAELAALYRGALGLVAPSLYEGFGLPALEAAACGCPVIVSKDGAQAEVMGEAALLVDPESMDEIATAMRSLTDSGVRSCLARRGTARAAMFTWDRTAALVSAALRDAMRG